MTSRMLLFLTLVAALTLLIAQGVFRDAARTQAAGGCDANPALDGQEEALLTLLNDYRREKGRPALTLSASLSRSAQWKAEDMGRANYLAHDDLPAGRGWKDRMVDCGYPSSAAAGEDIAAGFVSAREVFEAWRGSPGHAAIILEPGYVAVGLGHAIVDESTYGSYWVADFGSVLETPPLTAVASVAATPSPTAGTRPGSYHIVVAGTTRN